MMVRIIGEQANALQRPPTTITRLLETLAQHAPTFVAFVRSRIEGAP